ncbi:iron ABC transporter substrate-binding protein [Peptostreptococcus russellii]|uniref:Iron ABC transporter substrate-binding protein n=1 Tax=Peptostreptococcus russellii TaxID=215200 RepID=A0A2P7PYT9_9FIRM|nr:ABC transporter substrate-binding protein [Peptostreptococcus russellii]PSJ30874.1 iron ABC transporter substrate-binding protein [Peptostreptococcus russellii]
MNKYFSVNDKVYNIVEKNPKAIDFLISNGFEQFEDRGMFEKMSKNVSLSMALKLKKMNVDLFEERLVSFLEGETDSVDKALVGKVKKENADINIEGVLPCPIRIPLLEGFESWLEENKNKLDYSIDYELKSANMGLDWIKDQVKTGDVNQIADVLMSAGFDLFFDKELMGQFSDQDVFEAFTDEINSDFCNDYIDLRDPQKKYLITGVVPAVFLVNKDELNGRKIPTKWEDILSEEFEDSVAVPMGDLDLFNALVVTLYKDYGMDGISRLARSYMKNLHPAQMVKAKGKTKSTNPAVSIIPYFFTQMLSGENQVAVWPEDGAVISPIFMIAKKEKKEKIQPIIDFFMSKEIGEIFSANGKFPSTNKEVDNGLKEDQKFKWVGWDFIEKRDIGALLKELEAKFNEEIVK